MVHRVERIRCTSFLFVVVWAPLHTTGTLLVNGGVSDIYTVGTHVPWFLHPPLSIRNVTRFERDLILRYASDASHYY